MSQNDAPQLIGGGIRLIIDHYVTELVHGRALFPGNGQPLEDDLLRLSPAAPETVLQFRKRRRRDEHRHGLGQALFYLQRALKLDPPVNSNPLSLWGSAGCSAISRSNCSWVRKW